MVVDQTGVGRAVVDLMRQAIGWVVPVTITGGHAATVTEDHSFHVPKKELVTCLQVLMQSRRLRIARQLHEAAVLVRELQQFQVKITARQGRVYVPPLGAGLAARRPDGIR